MDCAVVYSEAALSDLHDITGFIAREDARRAKVFVNRLVDLAESLRRMPERGRPVKDRLDVRVVILSPYLIFTVSIGQPPATRFRLLVIL